eukprot:344904-Amorphochlora_amoeboformis.AAC.2
MHKASGRSYHVTFSPPKSMKLLSNGKPDVKTMKDDKTVIQIQRRARERDSKRESETESESVGGKQERERECERKGERMGNRAIRDYSQKERD